MLEKISLSVPTTGTTGSATGSTTNHDLVVGFIHAAYLTVPTSGTASVTLAAQSAPSENILSVGTVTTSAWYYPRREIVTNAGVSLNYEYDRYCIYDYLTLSASAATTAKTFQLDIFVEN